MYEGQQFNYGTFSLCISRKSLQKTIPAEGQTHLDESACKRKKIVNAPRLDFE